MVYTSLTTEQSLSTSMTVTISSTDISSDASVLFQKPSRSAVWKYFIATNGAHSACCAWRFFCTMVEQLLFWFLIQHPRKKYQSEVVVQKVKATNDTIQSSYPLCSLGSCKRANRLASFAWWKHKKKSCAFLLYLVNVEGHEANFNCLWQRLQWTTGILRAQLQASFNNICDCLSKNPTCLHSNWNSFYCPSL